MTLSATTVNAGIASFLGVLTLLLVMMLYAVIRGPRQAEGSQHAPAGNGTTPPSTSPGMQIVGTALKAGALFVPFVGGPLPSWLAMHSSWG